MPAVFGPYKGNSTLGAGCGQSHRKEGDRDDDGEGGGELEEVHQVVHMNKIASGIKSKRPPEGGLLLRLGQFS